MTVVTKQDYQFDAKLKVPTAAGDQPSPANRDLWIDSVAGKLAVRIAGATVLIPLPSEVGGAITVADTATLDLTLAAGEITGTVLDSPLLGGQSKAQIQTDIIAAISGGAAAAYDTLIEIQNLLEADDTADALITSAMAVRARFYAAALASGSPTATVTHNLNLTNIHDFIGKIFVSATGAEEEYAMVGATADTITVTDETGSNIAAGRRVFITAGV